MTYSEPLAEKIKSDNNIKGIQMEYRTHKILIYCDGTIIYFTDVNSTLCHINQIISQHSLLSGSNPNWGKCELLPLNKHFSISCVQNTKMKWKKN